MSQFFALVWLKWRLFRNSMRSRRAVVGRVAGALGLLAGLALALIVSVGLGAAAYFLTLPDGASGVSARAALDGFLSLFFIFTVMFLMWALMPLALGGGGRFEPGRMLLYPISLGRLFVFDFLSDLTGLAAVFAVPVSLAIGVGAGLANGSVAAGLVVSLCAVAFGLSFSKLLAVGVGALMRTKRTRGEMLLALLGAVLGMTGAAMGQLMPLVERYGAYFERARWTPSGAAAYALAFGLRKGGAGALAWSLLVLASYAAACVALSYAIARRTALGKGGASRRAAGDARKRKRAAGVDKKEKDESYAGWHLPLVSAEFSAVVEKELRYALRNAQLRVIALMAVGLTIVFRMAPLGGGTRRTWAMISPYAEGAGAVFSVLYIFTLVSPISTNLFGYDGAGMRALVLSPVSRRVILVAKNASVTFISLVLVTAGVFVGGLVFGDLTPRTLLFAALTFVNTAALFALFGNWVSLQFPVRVKFGKRMNRSGVGGILLIPFFLLLLVPPAVSVLAAQLSQSFVVKYVILAVFAAASVMLYALVVPLQGRWFERRELTILEAVTGRGGEEDSQIIG
jgi:ABC-2 type transport system permease protein